MKKNLLLLSIVFLLLLLGCEGPPDASGNPIDWHGLFRVLFAVVFLAGAPIWISIIVIGAVKLIIALFTNTAKAFRNTKDNDMYETKSSSEIRKILEDYDGEDMFD